MNDLDMARKWAKASEEPHMGEYERAAVEVIQSLPDQIVDGRRLRQIIDFQGISISYDARKDLESLLTPPPPTLADMPPEERQACQWMQARDNRGKLCVIERITSTARVLYEDGYSGEFQFYKVTPCPDLPKLEWPSLSVSGESEAVSVETEESEGLPRPEDVPAGEPWLVMNEGHRNQWVGTRDDSGTTNWPWILAKIDGTDYAFSQDVEVTLVSRLVPESKENA